MVEVLGLNLKGFFERAELESVNTYASDEYEVWEVSDEAYKAMCDMTEEDFEVMCPSGWWRSSEGSVLGVPNVKYIINGIKMIGWDGEVRKDFRVECCEKECDDFGNECKSSEEDRLLCYGERKYSSLTEYLCEEIGASMEKNICACAMDLAKFNNMTMGELFSKYEPISK